MKRRWSILFATSLVGLAGGSWLAQRLGMSSLRLWANLRLFGMIVAAVLAFVAMIRESRNRGFATWAAFACVPAALQWVDWWSELPQLLSFVGVPGALMIGGSFATIGVAVWIRLAPLPPEKSPLAEARVR